MVGPKKQDVWPKINVLVGNHCILRIPGAPVFQKKIIYEYQIRRSFFVIFEPLYFPKSCPIFDELPLPVFSKYNGFL